MVTKPHRWPTANETPEPQTLQRLNMNQYIYVHVAVYIEIYTYVNIYIYQCKLISFHIWIDRYWKNPFPILGFHATFQSSLQNSKPRLRYWPQVRDPGGSMFPWVDDMWMPRHYFMKAICVFVVLNGSLFWGGVVGGFCSMESNQQQKMIVGCVIIIKVWWFQRREGGLIILWRMDHGYSLGMMTSTDSTDFVQLVPIRVAAEISSDLKMVLRITQTTMRYVFRMWLGTRILWKYDAYRGRLWYFRTKDDLKHWFLRFGVWSLFKQHLCWWMILVHQKEHENHVQFQIQHYIAFMLGFFFPLIPQSSLFWSDFCWGFLTGTRSYLRHRAFCWNVPRCWGTSLVLYVLWYA